MDVYWTIPEKWPVSGHIPLISYYDPDPVKSIINKWPISQPTDALVDFRVCPAVQNIATNMFALKFPFDYDLTWSLTTGHVSSTFYTQDFFDKMVVIRSINDLMFSFHLHYLFMSEEPLEVEQIPAYLSNNGFSNSTVLIPGKFDIGQWTRTLDCAFTVKKGVQGIKFDRGDDYCYIKFLTKEKINFRKFLPSDRFIEITRGNIISKNYMNKKVNPLSFWYELYANSKMKKILMKEVKNNLID